MAGAVTTFSSQGNPSGFNFDFNAARFPFGAATGGAQQPTQYSGGGGGGQTMGGGGYGYMPATGMRTEEDRLAAEDKFNMMNAGFAHERDMAARRESAQLGAARMAADQRQQALSGLMGMFSQAQGQFSGNAPMPTPTFQPIQAPQLPQQKTIGAPDMAAAQQAQFARAKDQAGEVARSALAGLRSQLGGRNLLGSGAEYRGTANVANKGVQQLGELSRDQAIQGSEANQQAALANFQGGITQRAQDIGANQWVHQFNAQQQQAAQNWQLEQQQRQQDQQMKFMDMILNSIARY